MIRRCVLCALALTWGAIVAVIMLDFGRNVAPEIAELFNARSEVYAWDVVGTHRPPDRIVNH